MLQFLPFNPPAIIVIVNKVVKDLLWILGTARVLTEIYLDFVKLKLGLKGPAHDVISLKSCVFKTGSCQITYNHKMKRKIYYCSMKPETVCYQYHVDSFNKIFIILILKGPLIFAVFTCR